MTPSFKLDDDIPLPEADPSEELDRLVINTDDEEDDEDPEIPGKRGRKPRCKAIRFHQWERINETEERCKLCYEVFPCRNEAKCGHFDCWDARGKLHLHPWVLSGVMVPVGEANGESKKTDSEPGNDREDLPEQEAS